MPGSKPQASGKAIFGGKRHTGGKKGKVVLSGQLKWFRKIFSGELTARDEEKPEVVHIRRIYDADPVRFHAMMKDLEKQHSDVKQKVALNPVLAAAEKPKAVPPDVQAADTLRNIDELIAECVSKSQGD